MTKTRPVKVHGNGKVLIKLIDGPKPYLFVDSDNRMVWGFIDDARSLKRLQEFCKRCLKRRKK